MAKRRIGAVRPREQSGFTLIELLVSITVMIVLAGAAVGLLQVAVRSEPRIAERTESVQQARALMERVTQELRQGYGIDTALSSQLDILTYLKRTSCGGPAASSAIPCRVTYTCTSGICTRTELNPDGSGGGPTVQLVEGLSSSDVFEYLPGASQPDYVEMRLSFPAREGDDAITLDDGVALRNSGVVTS